MQFPFAQFLLKFYKNENIQKLTASLFRLWENYFFKLDIERARAFKCSLTIFYAHRPVYTKVIVKYLRGHGLFRASTIRLENETGTYIFRLCIP